MQWSGQSDEVFPKDPALGFSRAEIHALIGGVNLRIVSLYDGRVMAINDDAKGLPNVKATQIYRIGRGTGLAVAGNVLVGFAGEIS